jgi:Asp-tRNA(Asn)/Glu-tRNA(Gln) amidotransferase A subunit family amidase
VKDDILKAWKETIEKLSIAGAKIVPISLPHTSVSLPVKIVLFVYIYCLI